MRQKRATTLPGRFRLSRTRRSVLSMVSIILVASGVAACALEREAVDPIAPADGPNVIVVLVDDMRTDELRYMQQTTELMVDGGMSFPNAISPHPVCCPARAELLTGTYGQNNGVHHNSGAWGGYQALEDEVNTVPSWLHAGGYRTSFIGKYLNNYGRSTDNQTPPPGWTDWQPIVRRLSAYTDPTFFGEEPATGYTPHLIQDRALDVIQASAKGDRPFYLMINETAPHDRMEESEEGHPVHASPLPEPAYADFPVDRRTVPGLDHPQYMDKGVDFPRSMRGSWVARDEVVDRAVARIRSLQTVDDFMAELDATLTELGLQDDTYIVFASDNGYMQGEHRLRQKNWLTQESLQVPLLVRGPGIAPGTQDDRIASIVDLPATVLDLAGIAAGGTLDGSSLLPALRGQVSPWRDTTLVQTGTSQTGSSGWFFRGVMTTRYTLGHDMRPDVERGHFLFDHQVDPFEVRNVYYDPRYRDVVRELENRRRQLQTCTGDDLALPGQPSTSCNRIFGPTPGLRPLLQAG